MAKDNYHNHAMIALYPPADTAARHAITGGLTPDDMHVTMVYLGRTDDIDPDAINKAIQALPTRQPFAATIAGHARFTGDEQDVLVALIDSPHIETLRCDLIAALADQGVQQGSEHGFTAHMTLAYVDPQALSPIIRIPAEPVTFDALHLVYGTEHTVFPFGDPAAESIRPYARTAYAQGWAASGGPMTDAVKAGCIAAMDLCVEHAHDPAILEVALHLGHLEGVWATVFDRREKLYAHHTRIMKRLWRQAMADADVAGAVEIFRQQMGLSEAMRDAEWIRRAKATARDAAIRIMKWIPGKAVYQDMRDAMRAVLASGRAEGYADAIGVAASEQNILGYDFDIAFEHAYTALENLGETWAETDPWLERMMGRAADEFGRTLGDLAGSGAEYSQMLAAGMDILQDTVTDEGTVGFIVDWAASTGMSRGALDLYRSENVEQVTWMTAGDNTVCIVCEQYGIDSPFPIMDFPTMPAHPRCRCVASAEFVITPAYDGYF